MHSEYIELRDGGYYLAGTRIFAGFHCVLFQRGQVARSNP